MWSFEKNTLAFASPEKVEFQEETQQLRRKVRSDFDGGREFIGGVVKDVMNPKLLWVLPRYCWRLVKDWGVLRWLTRWEVVCQVFVQIVYNLVTSRKRMRSLRIFRNLLESFLRQNMTLQLLEMMCKSLDGQKLRVLTSVIREVTGRGHIMLWLTIPSTGSNLQ